METNITWLDLFNLIIILVLAFFVLKALSILLPQLASRKSVSSKVSKVSNHIIEIYKPVAILALLLAFVSVDYKVHGILLLIIIVIAYTYIKSFLNGVLFKINPLVNKGSVIKIGDFQGIIHKFLSFGIIISEDESERFINYSYINNKGFSINENEDNTMRKIIYLEDINNAETVLDKVFENPLVDYNHKPIIKPIPEENILQLQLTLEKGAQIETLIDYLNQFGIKTKLTKH
jgi:hypothetical protein